jgi:hypothetical protein
MGAAWTARAATEARMREAVEKRISNKFGKEKYYTVVKICRPAVRKIDGRLIIKVTRVITRGERWDAKLYTRAGLSAI